MNVTTVDFDDVLHECMFQVGKAHDRLFGSVDAQILHDVRLERHATLQAVDQPSVEGAIDPLDHTLVLGRPDGRQLRRDVQVFASFEKRGSGELLPVSWTPS